MSDPSQRPEATTCITPGCGRVIQAATARRTGGYCGPCFGERERVAYEKYVRENRKDVDLYAGVSDVVEMLRIVHEPRTRDPLVNLLPPPRTFEEIYCSLTEEEAQRVMDLAVEDLRAGRTDRARDVASYLAAFTGFDLDRMLETWVAMRNFWPPLAFRNAGARIRDAIISALSPGWFRATGSIRADHALQALAWIGGDEVTAFFGKSDRSRPRWAKGLHIRPSEYALAAAWEVTGEGRRDLSIPDCHALIPGEATPTPTDSVQVMRATEHACPWCRRPLVKLIRLDLAKLPFDSVNMGGKVFEVLTCDVCTCYQDDGFIYASLDEQGRGRLHPKNPGPSFLPTPLDWLPSPWAGVSVHLRRRSPTCAADWCLPTTLSQVGGLPGWVQDFNYPKCVECGRTMTFVAQIDQAQFRGFEGVYYAFVCQDCRVTATTYQQT